LETELRQRSFKAVEVPGPRERSGGSELKEGSSGMKSSLMSDRLHIVGIPLMALAIAAALPRPAEARTERDPEKARQVAVLLKVLSFDRSIQRDSRGTVRIGIVYNSQDPASVEEFERTGAKMVRHLDSRIARKRVTFIGIDSASDDLELVARRLGIGVFYVCSGNDHQLEALKRVSRSQRVLTMTSVPDYAAGGITVGLRGGATATPAVLINRKAALAEGRRFDPDFLELTELLR
jgi:hypothetical protein